MEVAEKRSNGAEKRKDIKERRQTPQSLLLFHKNSTTVCQPSQRCSHSRCCSPSPARLPCAVSVAHGHKQHTGGVWANKGYKSKREHSWCVGTPYLELLRVPKSLSLPLAVPQHGSSRWQLLSLLHRTCLLNYHTLKCF